MKRIVKTVMAAAVVFVCIQGKAQSTSTLKSSDYNANGARFGIGLNAGLGTNTAAGFVLGGDLRYQQPLGKSVSVIVTAGYTDFFKKTNGIDNIGVIPVKAGLKFFPSENFYIAGEAGAGFFTTSGAGTSFVFAPSVGYAFNNGLDLSVKYEDFTKYDVTQQVALRIAYGFKL